MHVKKPHAVRKRKRINNTAGPHLMTDIINGMAVCKKCHAVLVNRKWTLDEGSYEKKIDKKGTDKVLCPSCRKGTDKFPGGIVRVKGDFLAGHRSEILNLIKNEAQRAKGTNPLERIMSIHNIKTGIEIMTTHERLARRIGKSLQKIYQGRIYYKWTDDTKLLQAEWER